MMFRQLCVMIVALGATAQVVAQEIAPAQPAAPQAATPPPPSAEAKPVSETAAAPAPDAQANASSPAEGQVDADKIMAMQKAGYKIKNENGQVLFCRQDLQTGSRLRHKTACMTARDWEQLQEQNKLQLKALERQPRITKQ